MPGAPLPIDEARRLASLRACNILDTEPERAFDELVALATYVTEAPIALISLVDESRQWFKARSNLDVCETAREHAFCAYAILESGPLIVEDAAIDPRFSDNPLVKGVPGIRFYAGFPLDCGDGLRVGTLCVIDTRPRQLTTSQRGALQALAHQACAQLELRRVVQDLKALREREQHVADRTLEARAGESFRVGKVLHKGLAAELVEIAGSLQDTIADAVIQAPEVCAALDRAAERILAAALDCRAVADGFRDFTLLSRGWLESVRADISQLQLEHGVEILFEDGVDPDLLLRYASARRLAEFVHQALGVAMHQATSPQLRLSLSRRGSALRLSIRYLGPQRAATVLGAAPNSRMCALASELGSVVEEFHTAPWTELSLCVEMDSPVRTHLRHRAGPP